jgi:membrane fusion protein, multidrug efflux system
LKTVRKGRAALAALVGVGIVVAIVGVIAGVKALQFATIGEVLAAQAVPAERVNAVAVQREDWETRVSSVGSVVAVQGALISAEAEGVVREIRFEAGSVVKAGDELVLLDAEIEQAQLRSAEAAAELAAITFERAKRLIGQRAIAQADLETAEAALKQANAQVDNIRAVIAKKIVRAPFAGQVGIRRISVGQFLDKGSPLVSLQSLDPVYIEFSLPQQWLGDVTDGLVVEARADSHEGPPFEGRITAIEPHVDTSTRNVRIQATFANHGRLRPGMFVSVDVTLARSEPVLVIPATAIVHSPHGDSIFVIEESAVGDGASTLVVRQQPVRLGERRGDFVVARAGAEVGKQIVATGVFKLRAGMPVVIDNTLRPEFALAPKPSDG